MKKPFAAISLAISLILAGCTSTVIPKTPTPTQASFDAQTGKQDSGFMGFTTRPGTSIVYGNITTPNKVRYNSLMRRYGERFLPPVKPGEGLIEFTNQTWLIDRAHLVRFQQANRWWRQDRAKPKEFSIWRAEWIAPGVGAIILAVVLKRRRNKS